MKLLAVKMCHLLAWLCLIFSTVGIGQAIAVAYLVLTGQIEPGNPYFLDSLAPTPAEAIANLAFLIAMLIIGSTVRVLTRRYLHKMDPGG